MPDAKKPERKVTVTRWKSFEVSTSRPDLPQLKLLAKPLAIVGALGTVALVAGAFAVYQEEGSFQAAQEITTSLESDPVAQDTEKVHQDDSGELVPNGEKHTTADVTSEDSSSKESEMSAPETNVEQEATNTNGGSSTTNTVESEPSQPPSQPNQGTNQVRDSNPTPKRATVPDLAGLNVTQAVELLRSLGLNRWARSEVCSDVVPEFKIIASVPPAGSVIDLDYYNENSRSDNYFRMFRSSGPCEGSDTGFELAKRPVGGSSFFEPGLPPAEGVLYPKNIGIVGQWLSIDHEWVLEPYGGQPPVSKITLDYGASCTVTIDGSQKIPCLSPDGSRKTSVVVQADEKHAERFMIPLAEYGLSDPFEVEIEFFMDAPTYGYHKQLVTHRFAEGWGWR